MKCGFEARVAVLGFRCVSDSVYVNDVAKLRIRKYQDGQHRRWKIEYLHPYKRICLATGLCVSEIESLVAFHLNFLDIIGDKLK
jgi:hypothetical protein